MTLKNNALIWFELLRANHLYPACIQFRYTTDYNTCNKVRRVSKYHPIIVKLEVACIECLSKKEGRLCCCGVVKQSRQG